MKHILRLLLISVLLAPGCDKSSVNPALNIWKYYEVVNMDTKAYYVIPYFCNLLGLSILQKGGNPEEVKAYIQWYFDHLNYPDKYGLTGSIYDYYITQDGTEKKAEKCDSADSYAATFLILLNEYCKKTNNTVLIKKNWNKINDIAYLIAFLQDKDGLTKALPDSDAKYLMDNCECYGGLAAYAEMCLLMGKENIYYKKVQASIKEGILEALYDRKEKNFYWGISGGVKHKIDANIFYPDSFSQFFVILYGVLDGNGKINNSELWSKYGEKYKNKTAAFAVEQKIIYEMTLAKMIQKR
jgi:hypothetical protein